MSEEIQEKTKNIKDEKIIEKPFFIYYLFIAFIYVMVVLFIGMNAASLAGRVSYFLASAVDTFFFYLAIIVAVVYLLKSFIMYKMTSLIIDLHSVSVRRGLINIIETKIYLNNLEVPIVRQNILQRLFCVGDLQFIGTGGTKVIMPNVFQPFRVVEIITEFKEKQKNIKTHNN